jgi:hypothetical protein
VVGFTIGSRGKVPGKTCEKRITNNNDNNKLANFLCVFSILFESGDVSLFHTTESYCSFDLMKALKKQLNCLENIKYM